MLKEYCVQLKKYCSAGLSERSGGEEYSNLLKEHYILLKEYYSAGLSERSGGEEFYTGDLSEVAAELEYYSGSLSEALGANEQAEINLSKTRTTKKNHNAVSESDNAGLCFDKQLFIRSHAQGTYCKTSCPKTETTQVIFSCCLASDNRLIIPLYSAENQ